MALATAPWARADIDSYTENLSFVGSGLSCGTPACTGPYATLSVDLETTTTALITLTADSTANYQYLIGDDSQAAVLNVNSTNATVTGISATQLPGFTSISYTPHYYFGSPNGYDSLGYFNVNIDGTGSGFNTAATSISFTLTDVSGTWASAYNVLTNSGNDYNHDVGVPVYVCPAGSCTATSQITADHGTAGAAQVPESSSVLLLGAMMIALAAFVPTRFFARALINTL